MVLSCAVYFVQGILGLSRLGVSFMYKDEFHLEPASVSLLWPLQLHRFDLGHEGNRLCGNIMCSRSVSVPVAVLFKMKRAGRALLSCN